MENEIVPAYNGDEHTVEWDVDLTGAKKGTEPKAKK
jgi:hypothetical protein